MSMSASRANAHGIQSPRRFFTRLQQEGLFRPDVEANRGCRVLLHEHQRWQPQLSNQQELHIID